MGRKAVVCVDDEAIILMTIVSEIKKTLGSSYLYESAMSAKVGLEKIERLYEEGHSVALVVSDWLMPGMKGDEFLRATKEKHPEIEAIMVTGQADRDVIDSLTVDGIVRAVLMKPWSRSELHRAIDEIDRLRQDEPPRSSTSSPGRSE